MRISDWSSDVCSSDLPQGYMEAVKSLLREAAFDFAHYHQESFDITALNEEPLVEQAATLNQQDVFTVTLSRSGKTFSMPGNQTVLAAAKKAGAIVPRSEEHTSELQSLMRISYAVFCLKKKTIQKSKKN